MGLLVEVTVVVFGLRPWVGRAFAVGGRVDKILLLSGVGIS